MELVRIIQHGERLVDIIDEVKRLTFFNDCEYAVVKLSAGVRAIVRGERDEIRYFANEVLRLFGHSHPYSRPASGAASESDREALRILGQRTSYILEHGLLFKYSVEEQWP